MIFLLLAILQAAVNWREKITPPLVSTVSLKYSRRKKSPFSSLWRTFVLPYLHTMNSITAALNELFDRIPRRHSAENVVEINSVVAEYENRLIAIEAINPYYEKNIPIFFEELDLIRATIKKSTDNKASKKGKDGFFDEASGALKDSIQNLLALYADGTMAD